MRGDCIETELLIAINILLWVNFVNFDAILVGERSEEQILSPKYTKPFVTATAATAVHSHV